MNKRNNQAPGTAGHFMEEYRNYLDGFMDWLPDKKDVTTMKNMVLCKLTTELFYETIYQEILKRQPEETEEEPAAEDQPEGSEADTEREIIIDAITKAVTQLQSDLQEAGIECEVGVVERKARHGED